MCHNGQFSGISAGNLSSSEVSSTSVFSLHNSLRSVRQSLPSSSNTPRRPIKHQQAIFRVWSYCPAGSLNAWFQNTAQPAFHWSQDHLNTLWGFPSQSWWLCSWCLCYVPNHSRPMWTHAKELRWQEGSGFLLQNKRQPQKLHWNELLLISKNWIRRYRFQILRKSLCIKCILNDQQTL